MRLTKFRAQASLSFVGARMTHFARTPAKSERYFVAWYFVAWVNGRHRHYCTIDTNIIAKAPPWACIRPKATPLANFVAKIAPRLRWQTSKQYGDDHDDYLNTTRRYGGAL